MKLEITIHKYPSNLELEIQVNDDYGVIDYEVNDMSYEYHVDAIVSQIASAFNVDSKDIIEEVEDTLMPYHVNL